MTDKEKAKAYDEALERAKKELEQDLHESGVWAIQRIFPQLKESNVDKLEDDYVECAHAKGFREGYLFGLEKQKERDNEEECTDFTIYHPLKNGKGEYECIPYSFYGSLTSFSENKDLINFLRTCFYTEEECNEWIKQQKEQKSVGNKKEEMTEFEQSVYDLCPVLGIEEAKATASDLLELAKKTLLKTGKVVLTSNYPEGCSFEDGFHLGYNEGFNTKQKEQNLSTPKYRVGEVMRTKQEAAEGITDGLPVIMSVDDNYYYCTNEKIPISEQDEYEFPPMNMRQQSGKWSEEDEKMLDWCESVVRGFEIDHCNDDKSHSDWLKSIRPSWK